MDTAILVAEGQKLTSLLDETDIRPIGAMWVQSSETGNWKLWIVPSEVNMDKRHFYRLVAETISGSGLQSLDVGMVEMKQKTSKAFESMGKLFEVQGITSIYINDISVDGVEYPNGVIMRMCAA